MDAAERAARARETKCERWWAAVSLGRKPVPGGETNVWRRLERIFVSVAVWRMTPMPSLLAEPSHPRAMYVVLGAMMFGGTRIAG